MKRIFILLMAVCGALTLSAQVQNDPLDTVQTMLNRAINQRYMTQLSLSMKEAQQYAIQQNKSFQNASLEVKKAHAQRWQTIAAMLPQVDGTLGYTNMCGYEIDFGGMSRAMLPYFNANLTAAVGLNGQSIVGALLNNLAIEMQDISHEQSETELRSKVMSAYVTVLVMEDMVELLDSSLVNIQMLAEQTKQMVAVGTVEQTQADQIMVRVNSMKNTIKSTQRNVEIAYNALRVLLGVDAQTELILLDKTEDIFSAEQALKLLSANFNINNNYNYQLLQKNVELAEKNVIMAGMAYLPTLSAYYQYSYRKDFGEGGFSMSPPNTVGVSMSVPLWSSGKRAAGVTEKKIALQEAQNTFAETTDNLGIQDKQLRYNLANAYETYVNEKENIDVTARVMRNVSNKYTWGAASSLELTNASNDLISAESSYIQAVMTLVNAYVELDNFLNNK